MQCIHINIRKVTLVFLSLLINITQIRMAGNEMDLTNKQNGKDKQSFNNINISHKTNDSVLQCPSNKKCEELPENCLKCNYDYNCIYGNSMSIICQAKKEVKCKGEREINKTLICRYCYQTDVWEHSCDLKANCNSVSSPPSKYVTNCTVNKDVLCLGNRTFKKNVLCNWTSGYRWTTALALSITLGGFGADRFYLGHWQEGIGKLFSFGGLGVWTIIDVILISLHYLGPADGSLYI